MTCQGQKVRTTNHHAGVAGAIGPEAEADFALALQAFKERSGRMFPTMSEVREIPRDLGSERATLAAYAGGRSRLARSA